jgi:phospholipid N-methyltransferase
MHENLKLLRAFIKNPTKVGAIAPSSPDLGRQIVEGIVPDKDNIVLELGVGTGAITRCIYPLLPDNYSYLGLELDPKLCNATKMAFPELQIVEASAADAFDVHKKSGLGKVSYIICSIPFVSLPEETAEKICSEIDKFMSEGCMLRLFQYVHGYYLPPALRLRARMRQRYGRSVRSRMIVKNLPPAYTLTWSTL